MRVQVVDPSSYTPPYDHALCRALGLAGAEVELVTSRFAYGAVATPDRYVRRELFYRFALGAPGGRLRLASKLVEHVPDMLRYRRVARAADIAHFQWLPVQHLDCYLLPGAGGGRRPKRRPDGRKHPALVLTAHDVLPREPRRGQLAAQRRLYGRFDAVVVHSEQGRMRLISELGVDPERVHVIPHGVFTHLAEHVAGEPTPPRVLDEPLAPTFAGKPLPLTLPDKPPPPTPPDANKPVVLMFGLMRPYKGIDVLLDAWRGTPGQAPIEDAELWIVGMPKMDISALRAHAPDSVKFTPRFVADEELPAYFNRAHLVVLPYLQADQSGVLFTALAFGKPLLLSDVGGFPEMAATGAARIVPAGDAHALGQALRELLAERATLAEMCVKARAAAQGRYSWPAIAQAHIELYRTLLD